jgi:membrane-associated phospholipid phosphatase
VSIIYPLINSYRGGERIIEVYIDKIIPFNKYFVIPYVSWYGYVILFMVLFCIINERAYYRLLISLSVGMIICYVTFYIFPTTVPRPTIITKDIFSRLVLSIYKNDNPYNCFPSVHVVNAMIVSIYVNREEKFNKTIKIISSSVAFLIVVSTMFIKQHVFVDVVSGIIVAYAVYMAVCSFDIIKKRIAKSEIIEITEITEE